MAKQSSSYWRLSATAPLMIASFHAGKAAEMNEILRPAGIVCHSLSGMQETALCFPDPQSKKIWQSKSFDAVEVGKTFQENAELKGNFLWQITKQPCLAEDSGLEIQALQGQPGIYSARYGNTSGSQSSILSDEERCDLILKKLSHLPLGHQGRGARFVCTLALRWDRGISFFFGSCEGFIATEKKGSHGFGYDPIFCPIFPASAPIKKGQQALQENVSFGQMSQAEKNLLSHRRQACLQMARTVFGSFMVH